MHFHASEGHLVKNVSGALPAGSEGENRSLCVQELKAHVFLAPMVTHPSLVFFFWCSSPLSYARGAAWLLSLPYSFCRVSLSVLQGVPVEWADGCSTLCSVSHLNHSFLVMPFFWLLSYPLQCARCVTNTLFAHVQGSLAMKDVALELAGRVYLSPFFAW